jgi:RNA polymerase sigma factor (sigma-70 family)
MVRRAGPDEISRQAIMKNPGSERLRLQVATTPLRFPASPPSSSRSPVRESATQDPAIGSSLKGEALFLDSLPVIDDITGQVSRRHGLFGADAEVFRSDVRLHFIENDYEVLRRFEGRSSLPTYVTVVIQRLFLDHRNREWGRWRPSAAAKRLGPSAILLERLILRDGWTPEQAIELLRTNNGLTLDDKLRVFCVELARRRPSRQFVDQEQAEQVATLDPAPDTKVVRAEQDFLAKRVQASLDRARQSLDPEEQLVLRMRFEDAISVADIARALHLNQKRLYRTIERLLARIGADLEAEGISRSDVSALFSDGVLNWDQDHESQADAGTFPAELTRGSWLNKR